MKQSILALVFLSLSLQAVAGDVPVADTDALKTWSGTFVPRNGTFDLAGSKYANRLGDAASVAAGLVPWPGARVAIDVAGVVEDASIHAVDRETFLTEGDLLQVGKEAARLREIRAEGRDPKTDPEGQRILTWLDQQSRHTWDGTSYLKQSLQAHMGYTLVLDGTTLVASKMLAGPIYRRLFKANGISIVVNTHWNGRSPLFAQYDRAAKLAWKGWWKGLPDEAQKGVVEAVLSKAANASLSGLGSGRKPHSTSASVAPTLLMPTGSGHPVSGFIPLAPYLSPPRPVPAIPAPVPVAAPAPIPAPPVAQPAILAAPAAAPIPVAAPAVVPVPRAAPAAPPARSQGSSASDGYIDDERYLREPSRSSTSDETQTPHTHVEVRTRDEWRLIPVPAGFDGAGNPQFNQVWKKFPSAHTETVVVPDKE